MLIVFFYTQFHIPIYVVTLLVKFKTTRRFNMYLKPIMKEVGITMAIKIAIRKLDKSIT